MVELGELRSWMFGGVRRVTELGGWGGRMNGGVRVGGGVIWVGLRRATYLGIGLRLSLGAISRCSIWLTTKVRSVSETGGQNPVFCEYINNSSLNEVHLISFASCPAYVFTS